MMSPTPSSEESSYKSASNYGMQGDNYQLMSHSLQPQKSPQELQIWMEQPGIGYSVNIKNPYAYGNRPAPNLMGVKFVNSTPDSLEDQIKREELEPKKKRLRTTPEQLRILNKEFLVEQMPNASARGVLAKKVGMTPRAVQVWFQNRRAKAKIEAKKVNPGRLSSSKPPGIGDHRRAYSHGSVYHYPTKFNQSFYGPDDREDEQSNCDEPEYEEGKSGYPLEDYIGASSGLFLDPSEMVLLSPPMEQQQRKQMYPHHHSVPNLNSQTFAKQAYPPYQNGNFSSNGPASGTHMGRSEDPIDHRQRLSPFEPVTLGDDFYGNTLGSGSGGVANRANSLPMVNEFGSNLSEGSNTNQAMIPDQIGVSLQDSIIPHNPHMMYNYCNAFNASMPDINGAASAALGGANAPFYYHPPPPEMLAPFSQTALAGGNSSNIQKRSFSLPCVRPDLQQQMNPQSPGEDEELLLGLGSHIISNETEGRGIKSGSRSGIYTQGSIDRHL
jgi:hypothetical protein